MNRCDLPKDRLIPYDEALQQLIAKISPLQRVVRKPLLETFGEVLAESQQSTIDVPQADNSSMDGYALNISDLASSGATELPVSQRIAAGEAGEPLQPGTAARIFAGAAFSAVINFNARLSMVDAAFQTKIQDEGLHADWNRLQKRLKKHARKRNNVAHLTVVTFPQIADPDKMVYSAHSFIDGTKNPIEPVYLLKDVRQMTKDFHQLMLDFQAFIGRLPPS